MLVDASASMISRNNDNGYVPLHDAARNGNIDAVRQLLELGAPHQPRSSFGFTPARFAREAEHIELADFLGLYFDILCVTVSF